MLISEMDLSIMFKTRNGKWHTVGSVKIPQRTNIMEVIQTEGKKLRTESVNKALKEIY